ncbi:MAG: cytochrome c3 family protein [Planctomycetota bacterium]|jgi:DmsE family decaheme c-type cytochrome
MRFVVCLIGCLLLAGAAATLPAVVAAEESDCAICHEDVVADFQRTGHALAPGWDPATGCQSCHGPGDAHIEEGGDPEAIIRPQLLPRREASDGCLGCHQRMERHFSGAQSNHRLNEVGCLDCHNPHREVEKLLVADRLELCSGCHSAVASQFGRPRSHPLEDPGAACTTCHAPHDTRSVRTSVPAEVQACESCHFEKVGPFVYDHGSLLVDGCTACHELHGSTNRHLLRHESQVNLCYECHNANATPGWHSARRFVHEKCSACHSAIHGSNTSQFFLED